MLIKPEGSVERHQTISSWAVRTTWFDDIHSATRLSSNWPKPYSAFTRTHLHLAPLGLQFLARTLGRSLVTFEPRTRGVQLIGMLDSWSSDKWLPHSSKTDLSLKTITPPYLEQGYWFGPFPQEYAHTHPLEYAHTHPREYAYTHPREYAHTHPREYAHLFNML